MSSAAVETSEEDLSLALRQCVVVELLLAPDTHLARLGRTVPSFPADAPADAPSATLLEWITAPAEVAAESPAAAPADEPRRLTGLGPSSPSTAPRFFVVRGDLLVQEEATKRLLIQWIPEGTPPKMKMMFAQNTDKIKQLLREADGRPEDT